MTGAEGGNSESEVGGYNDWSAGAGSNICGGGVEPELPELPECIDAAVVTVLGTAVDVVQTRAENVVEVIMLGSEFVTVVIVDAVTSSADNADFDLVTTCVGRYAMISCFSVYAKLEFLYCLLLFVCAELGCLHHLLTRLCVLVGLILSWGELAGL